MRCCRQLKDQAIGLKLVRRYNYLRCIGPPSPTLRVTYVPYGHTDPYRGTSESGRVVEPCLPIWVWGQGAVWPVTCPYGWEGASDDGTCSAGTRLTIMRTANTIEVMGDPARIRPRIYQLAADIQYWPDILPHYRYLRVTEESDRHKIADFGASRDGVPVSWRARQDLFPDESRITFLHTGGVTCGMWVEWRLEDREDRVVVTIAHELTYPIPLIGPLFAQYIVGKLFVENIAGKTLRCFKSRVEAETSSAQQ